MMSSLVTNQAGLFRHCRHQLGLSVRGMQAALCVADERTIRRIESGEIDVLGSSWVAIAFMLREAELDDLAQQIEDICATIRDKNTSCRGQPDHI